MVSAVVQSYCLLAGLSRNWSLCRIYSNQSAPSILCMQLAPRLLPHLFPAPALWSGARRVGVSRRGVSRLRHLHCGVCAPSTLNAAENARRNVSNELIQDADDAGEALASAHEYVLHGTM